jgi:hypothetical protein
MRNNPWDIYESHPRFDDANKALEKAWDQAKRLAPELPTSDRAYQAEKHVYATMKLWSDVGAMDTEPVWVLRDRVRKHFGVDGNWL